MRLPKLSQCTAAAVLALSGLSNAHPSHQGVLQSQIAITWNAGVGDLGQLIANRLELPYQAICQPNASQIVKIEQGGSSNVAMALESVNQQMVGQVLELANSPTGLSLQLKPSNACPAMGSESLSLNANAQVASVQAVPNTVQMPRYALREGEPVHEQLQAWAKAAGWKLLWYPRVSWLVVSNADIGSHGDVASAVESVVTILRAEGKQILLSIAPANRLMEITSTDITAESSESHDE